VAGNEPIQATFGAFAVRMSDGSVSCWGNQECACDAKQTKNKQTNKQKKNKKKTKKFKK